MIHIDGSEHSGSGTIVRSAVSLATLLKEELYIENIRAKRDKPGLRAQHLEAVKACAEVCDGKLEGAKIGSREILFKPGNRLKGGYYERDIGTAGSTTMLASSVLPLACFTDKQLKFKITGGLFQDFAPSAYHMKYVLFPTLKKMGLYADLEIERPGYVPKGNGIIKVSAEPVKKLKPLKLTEQGNLVKIEGIALASHLKERKVSERMAKECRSILKPTSDAKIETLYDTTAIQPGATLALYAKTSTGCIIGSDRAGEPRRTAEAIGKYVAENLLEDLKTKATVDRYLADQLIIYCALADGRSEYRVPKITEHVDTLLWLVEKILGVKTEVKNNYIKIDGIGYER
ncbi:MAG: RNA 3'-terminal phosphate cyclase [Candidatus Aenigmarchaeota archaeon]|nr:RNA 3'-terminal phosphate cyclase [Candidatus Aenigmarchaeota archaeon]